MKNIKKKMSIENKSHKKKYSEPKLKKIGKINQSTLGGPGTNADSGSFAQS